MEIVRKYIEHHPGTHIRKIIRKYDLSMRTACSYIGRLEKDHKISRFITKNKKYIYPYGQLPSKRLLEQTESLIERTIIQKSGCRLKDIARECRISRGLAGYYLKKLLDCGFIEREKVGRSFIYNARLLREQPQLKLDDSMICPIETSTEKKVEGYLREHSKASGGELMKNCFLKSKHNDDLSAKDLILTLFGLENQGIIRPYEDKATGVKYYELTGR